MEKDSWAACVCTGLLLLSITAHGADFTKLIVFGDSLTDTGNAYAQSGGLVPPPPYFAGRFSDGPVWPEYVAGALSIELVNMAHGGAETGYVGSPSEAPSLLAQVDDFIDSAGGRVSIKAAYVVWSGANDLLTIADMGSASASVDSAVANVMLAIDRLRAAGAKKIVVANAPDLGLSPIADDNVFALSRKQLTKVTELFDARLRLAVAARRDKVVYYDAFGAHRHIIADPAGIGMKNVSHGCLETGCLNPSKYFYWDALHPTTKAHKAIADSMSALALSELGGDWIGLHSADAGKFRLDKSLKGGGAERALYFGPASGGVVPLAGDWKGKGVATVGIYKPATREVRLSLKNSANAKVIEYKVKGMEKRMIPFAGDWDGNGKTTLCFYDPKRGEFHMKKGHSSKAPKKIFRFGPKDTDWQPIAGDWDGDGRDTIGLYDATRGEYHLRNKNNKGKAHLRIRFGSRGGGRHALAGDWDGDGRDGIGLYDRDKAKFFLRDGLDDKPNESSFAFGKKGERWVPISGRWGQTP